METENLSLSDIADRFSDDTKARAFLEAQRWPDGAVCPHCGLVGESYHLEPKAGAKTHVRPGVWKCSACRKQFTVTVGAIFEDSHIPLRKWLLAVHLLCASKKGMSAHQLHRMLGVTYKSAWFMAHRIRYAMKERTLAPKLRGTVEIDETYVGGKIKGQGIFKAKQQKVPVVSLVERHGDLRSFQLEKVSATNIRPLLKQHVQQRAHLMTDDSMVYADLKARFASHDVIQHNSGKYSRHEVGRIVHTNTIEGYFSILKRGIFGIYHHVGRQHLHRYLSEFDFRYNARDVKDGERSMLAIKGCEGKRLTYKPPSSGNSSHLTSAKESAHGEKREEK